MLVLRRLMPGSDRSPPAPWPPGKRIERRRLPSGRCRVDDQVLRIRVDGMIVGPSTRYERQSRGPFRAENVRWKRLLGVRTDRVHDIVHVAAVDGGDRDVVAEAKFLQLVKDAVGRVRVLVPGNEHRSGGVPR